MSRQTLRRRGYSLSASLLAIGVYAALVLMGLYLVWVRVRGGS